MPRQKKRWGTYRSATAAMVALAGFAALVLWGWWPWDEAVDRASSRSGTGDGRQSDLERQTLALATQAPSPALVGPAIVVGCCRPAAPSQMDFCRFWAPALGARLFPGRRVVYRETPCQPGGCPHCRPNDCGDEEADILFCDGSNYAPSVLNSWNSAPTAAAAVSSSANVHVPEMVRKHARGRPYLVAFSGEAWDNGACKFDVIFSCHRLSHFDGCPTIYAPVAFQSFGIRTLFAPRDLIRSSAAERSAAAAALRPRFAAFMYNDCWHPRYRCDNVLMQCAVVGLRIAFVRALGEYKKVDALGKCGGGTNFPMDRPAVIREVRRRFAESQGEDVSAQELNKWFATPRYRGNVSLPTFLDTKVVGFEGYKFAVAFENSPATGYFTEKMVDVVLSGAVPIYFGASDIDEMVNEKAFVHCRFPREKLLRLVSEFGPKRNAELERERGEPLIRRSRELFSEELAECVKRVKELDSDDQLYKAMLREPFLHGNKLEGSVFDLDAYAADLRRSLQAAGSYLLEES
eukprot:TRINITY_DN16830_c0_g1_i2.p1 TRINITY_DN16830_c0_g1~~TRINITY_DN16830_c0_g1_i2.p1  ORF type:complete len:519 (-),score=118.08 TRINITY_DN16830_c0_g1_i2:106-1662(-)